MPGNNQNVIVTHSILIGLTPLIPIPLADDLARTYLQRRLVRKITASVGLQLDEAALKTLADSRDEGCLWGCLVSITLGLVKWIFRKVFFFLEWKRAIDLICRSYYHAYLLDAVFTSGWCAPAGPRTPAEVRMAVDEVCRTAPVKPLEHAVKLTFNQSKSLFKTASRAMARNVKRVFRRSTPAEVEQAVERMEQQKEEEIQRMAASLRGAISAIPEEHFRRLREQLAVRLGFPPELGTR